MKQANHDLTYELSRMVLGSSASLPITKQQFDMIEQAKRNLIEALYIEEKFTLILDNYLEFETDLLDYAARNMVRFIGDYAEFQVNRSQINRRIINLLTTCKSYLDQTPGHLMKIFGRRSEVVKRFEAELVHQDQSCVAYKIMSAIRNFAQHKGYPIGGVIYPNKWSGEGEDARLLFSVTPLIDLKEVLEDGKFDPVALKHLHGLGGKVDARPVVRDYLSSIGAIHENVRASMRFYIAEWEALIFEAIESFKREFPGEESVVGLAALAKDKSTKGYREVPLFTGFIEYRKRLVAQTASLSNLSKRYVTSEVHK